MNYLIWVAGKVRAGNRALGRVANSRLLINSIVLSGLVLNSAVLRSAEPLPSGDSTIRAKASESEIVITTTTRLAGAIHSLTWNGREFIDSADHGRQLQSASNFDAGQSLTNETFNPTEAGSRRDGAGPSSTSQLLHLIANANRLQTTNRMAFWLAPGENSDGNQAKNTAALSNHLVTKRVEIGYQNLPHVIRYEVTFSLPIAERHRHGVFESITGYMPADFQDFLIYDRAKDEFEPIDDGPGEQSFPIVMSTKSGSHAMGIYSPDQPSRGYETVGYGRFRFPTEKVVKWNCVFRSDAPEGLAPGEYSFRNFVIVGDLPTVKQSMRELHREFAKSPQSKSR